MRKIKRSSLALMLSRCVRTSLLQLQHSLRAAGSHQHGTCGTGGGHFQRRLRRLIRTDSSVDRRISNLHAAVLHPEVGSLGHADEKPRLHHTWGGRDGERSVGLFFFLPSPVCDDNWLHLNSSPERFSPGIILMAVLTSLQFWACSNFQSRMKLLLSVTTGPWETDGHNSKHNPEYSKTQKTVLENKSDLTEYNSLVWLVLF